MANFEKDGVPVMSETHTKDASISIPMIPMESHNKVAECRTEKVSTFQDKGEENHWNNNHDGENEHLRKSGQLGMCDDPYCTTCPTYFKASQKRNPKASTIFYPKVFFFLK